MKRNVRSLLPGEWFLTNQGIPAQVHHLEIVPEGLGATVLICCGKHTPDFTPMPAVRGIHDDVEVVRPKPKIEFVWDSEADDWVVKQ